MKIKNDFVTNSSSCSYIVCIPDMNKFIKELSKKIEVPEKFIDKFRRNHEYINFGYDYEDDESGYSTYDKFNEMHAVVEDLGYVIMFDEGGPENQPTYLNIAYCSKRINQLKKILGEK